MKRILLIAVLGCCLSVHAQQKKDYKNTEKEFRAKKEAYMAKQAELTPEEIEMFFPIYNELQERKKEVNKKAWKEAKKSKNPQTSEKEYEDILNGFIEADKINNELDKQYMKKFQKILSNKKIYKVLKAEIKFQRNMLKIVQQDNPQK